MGLNKPAWLSLLCCLFLVLFLKAHESDASEVTVKFLRTPKPITNRSYATFAFEVLVGSNGSTCFDCSTRCKLDDHTPSDCEGEKISYTRLQDGNHTFEVCNNGTRGVGCASYNWIIDTVSPTAYVTAATYFTNGLTVPVYITFSEPCTGGDGFGCSSLDACNLLVYGAGQVIPNTLNVIQPGVKYSLMVRLSPSLQYGRAIVIMDKNFCSDSAGNKFLRTENSSLFIHFDRRSVFVDFRTYIPERLLQLNGTTRTVLATREHKNLEVYLYFSEPVVNSSNEILSSLYTNLGSLLPISGDTLGNRRFGFQVTDISPVAIVTVSLNSSSVISRQGTPVSPVTPITFLYDSKRPGVSLSTTSHTRTREKSISIMIKFEKPVFGFNFSHVTITGGHLQSFHEISRSSYSVGVLADGDTILVNVPENITSDVAGNKNLASNILQVKHYSVPTISVVVSAIATAAFAATSLVAGILTISTASLQSMGAFSKPTAIFNSDPGRNLFRIASHIQVFALSRWLAVSLPVEYYEFARGLEWSIPYLTLPWETGKPQSIMVGSISPTNSNPYSSKIYDLGISARMKPKEEKFDKAATVYGLPLTPMEYRSFFESQGSLPEAEYIWDPHNSNGWRDFNRSMFWLAVIGGGLILLHCLVLLILRYRKKSVEKQGTYGALLFPRFEIFLLILALPCVCEASAALVKGGACSGIVVGILLLGAVFFLLLALLLFLSIGISMGKLLQYKEVHHEGEKFHWYQEIIRVTLGPGKKGQWTWKNQPNSISLTMFGPLFEDLRGPPKYMLSQFSGGNSIKLGDSIIASDDETEDAEAPFIQKVFGILRIYYTLLESVKRFSLGILAGAYSSNWSSRTPTITLLSITSFQLFFMVLKKPFIKKKVQLVEIISVSCEVGIFASCMILLEREFSAKDETKLGIFMISLFLLAFSAQLINEWYSLYRQIKQLDPAGKSFARGLRTASIGFLLFFIPRKFIKNLNNLNADTRENAPSADRNGSSASRSSSDRPWLRQLKELAKTSFSKERNEAPTDPSTSRSRWSEFWNSKRSGSSSLSSPADFKPKPRSLYKDLEAVFASK